MQTQQDTKVRMVALTNLRAMCKRISSVCHRYEVTKVTRSRVHVTYSNPDEYGRESPMTAVYPCFPSPWPKDGDNPSVLLMLMRVLNDSWDGEGWQSFDALEGCPTLWRSPGGDDKPWRTHGQVRRDGDDKSQPTDRDTCVVCDLPKETP